MSAADARHLRWPADRFYWAVLEDISIPARRLGTASSRAVLNESFESHLPRDVAAVATAFMHLEPGRVLACGVPEDRLAELPIGTVTLSPADLPETVTGNVDAAQLNILVHSREPAVVCRVRRQRALTLCIGVVLACSLAVVGAERRSSVARHREAAARDAMAALWQGQIAAGLGLDERDGSRLAGLVADLERRVRGDEPSFDPGLVLQAILQRWPPGVATKVDVLSLGEHTASVSCTVPNHAEAQDLATALGTLPGWSLAQPQVQAGGRDDCVRVLLTLKPEEHP